MSRIDSKPSFVTRHEEAHSPGANYSVGHRICDRIWASVRVNWNVWLRHELQILYRRVRPITCRGGLWILATVS